MLQCQGKLAFCVDFRFLHKGISIILLCNLTHARLIIESGGYIASL